MSLDQPTRQIIGGLVSESPGLHLREIQRRTGIAIGSLMYHIEILRKSGAVVVENRRGKTRLFPTSIDAGERDNLDLLRQATVRSTVLYLIGSPGAMHKDLVDHLNLAPSTVSWYLKRLERTGAIRVEIEGRKRRYSVIDPVEIVRTLKAYRASFKDRLLDNFISFWDNGR
ncbi:MAG: winged helix-turn-helix transcriptional regulator [Candidatus Geothermarchaeales archaeon]